MNCPLSTEQIMMAYHCSKEAAILVRALFNLVLFLQALLLAQKQKLGV